MSVPAQQLINVVEWRVLKHYRKIYQAEIAEECKHNQIKVPELEVLTYPNLGSLFKVSNGTWPWFNYRERASFILVVPPTKDRKPVPIVVIDAAEKRLSDKDIQKRRDIFKKFGVDYACEAEETHPIHDRNRNHRKDRDNYALEGSFNYYQYICVMSFVPTFITHHEEPIVVVHEPSLDRILGLNQHSVKIINDVNREAKNSHIPDEVGKNFHKNTSIDGLVCIGCPNSVPLFGFEYDGGIHRRSKKQKLNDSAKDRLFGKAGIPLIRVSSEYFKPDNPDAEYFGFINSQIGSKLLTDRLSADNYIDMLLHFLKNEEEAIGIEKLAGSNISTLRERLAEYISKRKSEFANLRKDYESTKSFVDDYYGQFAAYDDYNWADSQKQNLKEKQLNRYGMEVDVEIKQEGSKYTAFATLAPTKEQRSLGVTISVMPLGPYEVLDSATSIDFGVQISQGLRIAIDHRLYDYFTKGDPSLRDRLSYLLKKKRWVSDTHSQRVLRWMNGRFWDSIGKVLFGMKLFDNDLSSDNVKDYYCDLGDPEEEYRNIKSGIMNPLLDVPNGEKIAVLKEIRLIDEKLRNGNSARFILDETFFFTGALRWRSLDPI
ncbi:hypothetical protein ACFL17_05950 [Pseudomonadota bacterium]